MKSGFAWGAVLGALLGGAVGGAVIWVLQGSTFRLDPGEMTYEQLAALLLGGSALFVTLIGVFVAVLALWGYAHFKTMSQEAAKGAAIEKIESELQDGGEVKRQIEIVVTRFLEDGFQSGALVALLEERAKEAEALRKLDAQWGDQMKVKEVDQSGENGPGKAEAKARPARAKTKEKKDAK